MRQAIAVATTTSAMPSGFGPIAAAIAMPLPDTSPTASGASTAASTMRGRARSKRVHARDAKYAMTDDGPTIASKLTIAPPTPASL